MCNFWLLVCFFQESRHDKEKEKKEKRDSTGGKEEKKQYPFTCQHFRKNTKKVAFYYII